MNSNIHKNRYFAFNANEQKNYDTKSLTNTDSSMHLTETEEGYHLEMEIAGYVKEDFNFYINNNDLVLTTDRSKEKDLETKEGNNTIKHAYCYASAFLRRTFHLPKAVEKNKIFVDYRNHILSIDLFKLKPSL